MAVVTLYNSPVPLYIFSPAVHAATMARDLLGTLPRGNSTAVALIVAVVVFEMEMSYKKQLSKQIST